MAGGYVLLDAGDTCSTCSTYSQDAAEPGMQPTFGVCCQKPVVPAGGGEGGR
jgi:hypothetical protein